MTTLPEDDDEVAADADGALEADDHQTVLGSPPAGVGIALWQGTSQPAHPEQCAVEYI